MTGKEDPLNQTLWLDGDKMVTARDNWWTAYRQGEGAEFESDNATVRSQRDIWNTSWAAAMAAYAFMTEGRLGPRR